MSNLTLLAVGDRVGPYRVVGHLVGNTYRAVAIGLPRRYLLEVAPIALWREAAVHMMRAEQMVAMLQHPGVARIVDRGVLPDRRSWTATEVPSGLGLYDLIARRVMPASEATALIRDVAEVLEHAHARDVVHRALTLRSIVLATGDRAYPIAITDWGIVIDDLGVFGAPELATGSCDGRADVYALGVIAYRAVTKKFPDERGVDDVPGVPDGLATLIARMLARDPDERPTAAEVRALAGELIATGTADGVTPAVSQAAELATGTPELLGLAEDTEPHGEDIVRVRRPRFAKPKWTPSPDFTITSERAPTAAGEIDAPARED